MIKSKKQMYIVIGAFALVMLLGSITYAFFNYTRTGVANSIRVGRIYFNTQENDTINLTNVFPISSSEATGENDNYGEIVIEIEGDTDYSEGIEYLVSSVDTNIYTSTGKTVPLSLDVSVTGLGTSNANYFTARESKNATIYKKLVGDTLVGDQMLLVGYIAPNTTSGTPEGIDGSITIKAYLDKDKIGISDTYPSGDVSHTEGSNEVFDYTNDTSDEWANGRTILTTTEWNVLQQNGVSFKVKVEANEGIWVEEPLALAAAISRKVSTVDYIVSYDDVIAQALTQNKVFTTQDQVSTSATKQTVYYYTGSNASANANVLFAGYCWQIVRTTDNGGVKLLYNGVAENDQCEITRGVTKGINGAEAGHSTSLSSATLFGRNYDYDLDTGVFTLQDSAGLPTVWSENDSNNNGMKDYEELIGTYTCISDSATCTTLYYVGSYISRSVNGTDAYIDSYTIGDVAHFSQMGTSAFNAYYGSAALVGYMFNKEYDYKSGSKSGEYYTNVVWENGSYTLSSGNGGTSPDATHHYICDTNCTKVRYYYYSSSYYILLENGKTVEDALKEMINYKANANDSDENINVYNSAIKGYLDNWYKKNLTAYASYLDNDIVFCNDRSVRDLGGWNPSGTNLSGYLQFYQYSSNKDLKCKNETDRFSKSNNKAKLDYPIGMLSEPERNLMTANFAKTGQNYWTFSPSYVGSDCARGHTVSTMGADITYYYVNSSYGVRGVISLKPGTMFDRGTGTYTDPYIVGPIVER